MTTRRIDLRGMIGMTRRQQEARLRRVGAAVWREWRAESSKLKPRYRVPYNAAMRMDVNVSRGTVKLRLDTSGSTGTLVRSIEYGFGPGGVGTRGPYDMRFTLLRSPKVKFGRRGRYLNVPMRVTTRQMTARGGSAAYAAARNLTASIPGAHGTRWGGRLSDPSGFASKIQPRSRYVRGIGIVPPHKTDPLASLYKFRRRGAKRSTYGIFRTISERGKPWVHPGIPAHRLMRKVAGRIKHIAHGVA